MHYDFDLLGLLHSIIYYKSHYPNALEEMRNIINMGENGG